MKKMKSRLTINSETTLALFVRKLLKYVLYDYSDGLFGPQMIEFCMKRFITSPFLTEKFCERSIFKRRNFVKF